MKRTNITLHDVKFFAHDILAKTLDANTGCAQSSSIATKPEYPVVLEVFPALAHDQSGHEHVGISSGDCVDDIFEACRMLLNDSSNDE